MEKKNVKITVWILLGIVGAFLLTVIGYLCYVIFEYDRIEDSLVLEVKAPDIAQESLKTETEYSIITYNVGFGAYSPEYSFFMDSGVRDDGKKITGKYGKGISKEDVEKNVSGAVGHVKNANADFVLLQEVDQKANRSYFINQREAFSLQGYSTVFAQNFHSAYLFYPFHDPIGKSDSGIMTLSRYKIDSAVRRSLPLATDLSKFFDLDRCFSVSRLPVEGTDKEFVLINVHLSAYDKGGTIRAKQTQMFTDLLKAESEAGNFVLAGGDFNQLLNEATFPTNQPGQNWAMPFPTENLPSGYTVIAPIDTPTCRNANMEYVKGESYTCVIDGFIVSKNVIAKVAQTGLSEFEFSDHNPVHTIFKLAI